MNKLLPNIEIWGIIDDIISKGYQFNVDKLLSEIDDEGSSELNRFMDDYYTQTFNLPSKIDYLVQDIQGVNFSYKYYSAASIKQKLKQMNKDRPPYLAENHLLELRFVLKTNNDNLLVTVEQFLSNCPFGEQAYEIEKQTIGNQPYNGKIVIHVNHKNDNLAIPVELQFCTRSHALLIEYLQEDINKIEDMEQVNYALELKDWLESVSQTIGQEGFKIQSYVDYIYEKNFTIEEDEPNGNKLDQRLHSNLSHFKNVRFIKQSKIFIYSENDQSIMIEAQEPRAGREIFLNLKKHFPSENFGIMGAKDIQTLLRTHRELKLTQVTRNIDKFLKTLSLTKETVYA